MKASKTLILAAASCLAAVTVCERSIRAEPKSERDLARQIFETMVKVHGVEQGHRPVHAKGLVCRGTFEASADAASLSKAAHFRGGAKTPIIVRFSDGSPETAIPDNAPNVGPRGMAIRFELPADTGSTDIVAISHNGFVVANGEEFLALQKAILATDPSQPHPWPIEVFLSTHPKAMQFVRDNSSIPESFASESFFSNDAFVLINGDGKHQPFRYKILPMAGDKRLSEEEAKQKSPNYLMGDLKQRIAAEPVRFRLVAQLPNSGDATDDPSVVWPDNRKTVELGVLVVSSVSPDSAEAESHLAFDPTNLTEGIDLSDDQLPSLRSRVYALSAKRRHSD